MTSRLFISGLVVGLLQVLLIGMASGGESLWQSQIQNRVPVGQKAHLTLVPTAHVRQVEFELQNAEGKSVRTWKFKRVRKGKALDFKWKVPLGESKWTGVISCKHGSALHKAQLQLSMVSMPRLDVGFSKEDVFMDKRLIIVQPSHALAWAEMNIFNDQGEQIAEERTPIEAKTKRVEIKLPSLEGQTIRRVELKLEDNYGQWVQIRVVHWYAEIPHDDVEFETGQATVRPEEAGKIDAVLHQIEAEQVAFRKELGRVDASLDLKLYVGGFTDTVGQSNDNLKLSLERARAIAQYFRKKGIKGQIYYAGFGETHPAVPTADNVAEARNRRAIYVITNAKPQGFVPPRGKWLQIP